MDYLGSGSGKKRIVLLRDAAKQLVRRWLARRARSQLDKPVQFALVLRIRHVGPQNAGG